MSIWQMAIEPSDDIVHSEEIDSGLIANGYTNHGTHSDSESSQSDDDDDDSDEPHAVPTRSNYQRLAIACDDGCVRLYNVSDTDGLTYYRSFPRVSG